jgi:regulatory protein
MPTITDIKKQRRVETQYNVYIDGRYSFSLTDLELSSAGLRIGQDLTSAEVTRYQEQAGQAKAYMVAVRYVSVRPRSRREIADYLCRKGYLDGDTNVALERLEQVGLVNDRQFAASWIADRQALRPRSRRVLAQELAAKGVARDDIESQLSTVDDEAELQTATRLAEKKHKLPQYANPQQLISYLLRHGYSYATAKRALETLGLE